MNFANEAVNRIINIANKRSLSFEKEPFSVFFLLYAKKIGCYKSMEDYFLSSKLDERFQYDDIFQGLYERFQKFLQSFKFTGDWFYACCLLETFLNSVDNNLYQKHYCDIIERLMRYLARYSGSYMGVCSQPSSITRLVGEIVNKMHPNCIYNPFAGLSSYAFISDSDYYGQEINVDTYLLAQIRLDAYDKNIKLLRRENSIDNWCDLFADCLVSTPPFGLKLNGVYQRENSQLYRSIEEFILSKFLYSSMKKAVLIMPMSVCFSQQLFAVRKAIVEKNALEMVVELPAGVFYETGVRTAVIVLNKCRSSNQITIVDGQECLVSQVKTKDLDVDAVLNIIHSGDATHKVAINRDEMFHRDASWSFSAYAPFVEEIEEGKMLLPLSDVIVSGTPIANNETYGIVLSPSDFSDSINVLFDECSPKRDNISPSHKAYIGKHIVLSSLQNKIKVCICSFDEPFYLNQNQVAFSLKKDSQISLEYMVYAILNSKNVQRLASMMNSVSVRVTRQLAKQILDCKVAIHSDVAERDNTIIFAKEEYTNMRKNAIQSEMQRLGIRDASSDLSHVLGASFHKISTAIDFMQNEKLSDEAMQTINSIRDNFAYMKRMITTVGADFETQRLNLQEVEVNSFIKSYTESWSNLGYSVFELAYHSGISDSVSIKIDEDMFRVIFDTVLRNAYKHGFGAQRSSDNKVYIETSLVTYNDTEYVLLGIANNGTPFPKELTIEKYVKRGGFAGVTGNTGLGGYHVYSIVKRHNGFFNISSSQAWGAIVEMLVPVEFYEEKDTDKFEEYGNTETCI